MVVVTGASGHVGGVLVRELLARGRKVRALVRSDTRALEGLQAEVCRGDLTDPAFAGKALRGADTVFHLASEISLSGRSRGELEALNVGGVRNVIAACRANRVQRLVHFSSIHALDDRPRRLPMDESRPLVQRAGHSAYDRSKADGERLVRQAIEEGLNAVIVNPTGIVGPLDFKPSHLGEVVREMASGGMRALVGGGFDWVDVRDVAQAAVIAAERAPAGGRYILSGHWVSIADMAAAVDRAVGRRRFRVVLPWLVAAATAPVAVALARAAGTRPLYTPYSIATLRFNRNISSERARRELGYAPRPFEQTVRDTVAWFRQH